MDGRRVGDHALASDLRTHEERYRRGDDPEIVPEIVDAIRGRYDLTDDGNDCPGAIEESQTHDPARQEVA